MPPVDTLISTRPTSWQGMQIEWSSKASPVPVFLGKLPATKAEGGDGLYIFGARYELSDALIDGQSLGPGYFVEYFVVWERSPEGWAVQRLLQHQSVTFSEIDEPHDYVAAESVTDRKALCLNDLPRWKDSEAVWPTCDKRPMTFHGQLALPDTKVTRNQFTWGVNIYLFSARRGGSSVFKIVGQDSDFQTAEEHYASECDGS